MVVAATQVEGQVADLRVELELRPINLGLRDVDDCALAARIDGGRLHILVVVVERGQAASQSAIEEIAFVAGFESRDRLRREPQRNQVARIQSAGLVAAGGGDIQGGLRIGKKAKG